MKLFDGYVAVDWSANGKPKQGKDSIWIAIRGVSGTEESENPATRREAVGRIERLLEKATAARRRLLVGFDFPFGYPAGTARDADRSGWLGGRLVADRRSDRGRSAQREQPLRRRGVAERRFGR